MAVFAFGNNLSSTNFLTLCKNDVVHNMMSNALLLITQQRHRRKTSKQPRRSMCACVCYTACATVCVCASCRRSMLAEDAGSSAGKVNWALCWVNAYSVQTKGPIKKKKKACYWQLKSQTLNDGAFLAVSDQWHGWSQTVTSSEPTTPLVSKVVPTRDLGARSRRMVRRHWKAANSTRRLAATQSVHNTHTLSYTKLLSGTIFNQQRAKC